MTKEISLKLLLTKSKNNFSISHDFEKVNKYPISIVEINGISFVESNTTLLKDLQLLDIFKSTEFKINISDSHNLCSPSFIKEVDANEYTSISDAELIFGELDFYNENMEINIWWIINKPSKFLMIKNDLVQSTSSAFEVTLPQSLFYDIKKNANFIFYPNRIKTRSQHL